MEFLHFSMDFPQFSMDFPQFSMDFLQFSMDLQPPKTLHRGAFQRRPGRKRWSWPHLRPHRMRDQDLRPQFQKNVGIRWFHHEKWWFHMSFMGKNGDFMELRMGFSWWDMMIPNFTWGFRGIALTKSSSRDAVVWSVFDHQLGSIQVSVSTSSTKWNFLLNVKAW